MTYPLDLWRADLNAHAAAFAALFKDNRTLSPSYGITATCRDGDYPFDDDDRSGFRVVVVLRSPY